MNEKAIKINNLKKTYSGPFEALKGISLEVEKGDFFGLLGPNGAGKSTSIGIISGLINKSEGDVIINGYNIETHLPEAKSQLGVVPQEFNFNIFETCIQIVVNQAGYYGVPASIAKERAHHLFKELDLTDKTYTQSGKLSGGLKRRLMIARALVHEPKILILDEPTAGVDINLRRTMWTFIENLNKNGTTIILTTHYLEEAEALCKNLAIIDKGEIIEKAPTDTLLKRLSKETIILYCESVPNDLSIPNTNLTVVDPQTIEVDLDKDLTVSQIVETLKEKGVKVNRMKNKANRLEELFVNLTESK